MKTREEIAALKLNWLKDNIWDIEKTEGFEEHYEELLAFRKEQEAKWEAERKADISNRADATGIDIHTAQYITSFEEIESMLQSLDSQVGDCGSAVAYANLEISRAQVRSILLLTAQVKRLADTLDGMVTNEGLIVSATTVNKYDL